MALSPETKQKITDLAKGAVKAAAVAALAYGAQIGCEWLVAEIPGYFPGSATAAKAVAILTTVAAYLKRSPIGKK